MAPQMRRETKASVPWIAAPQGDSPPTGPQCSWAPSTQSRFLRPRWGKQWFSPCAQTLLGTCKYCSLVWLPGLLTGPWGGHMSTEEPGLRGSGSRGHQKGHTQSQHRSRAEQPTAPGGRDPDPTLHTPSPQHHQENPRARMDTCARTRNGPQDHLGACDHRIKMLRGGGQGCPQRWVEAADWSVTCEEDPLLTRLRSTENITACCSPAAYMHTTHSELRKRLWGGGRVCV